ncbi:MAG: IclR family transcriptional regulator [Actinobacteria bacterium]|nr:IclR family transcriptional regulator [Actinomycetota bacterium]
MAQENNGDGEIRSVHRAIGILNCFSWDKRELGLTEIATLIGLPKSTTSRILQTLTTSGLLQRDAESGRYRLGFRLFCLGSIVKDSMELRTIAIPTMVALRDKSRETVNLYLREGTRRVCIHQVESLLGVRHMVRIGEQLPLWAGASGKVLLAHMDESGRERVFQEALAVSANFRPDRLTAQLEDIKRQGYAVSHGERELGASAVAAPIWNADRHVEAAVTISGPTARWTAEDVDLFVRLVREGAAEISRQLGYQPQSGRAFG